MPVVSDPAVYNPANILDVDLSEIKWRATGSWLGGHADSRCRLSAIIKIAGADHHVDALQVTFTDDVQSGANGSEEEYDDLCLFAGGGDGPFETVSIEGRMYVITMSPFRS